MFIDENNLLYSFGRPEHGQLGHNTDGQHFISANKLAFNCEVLPRHVAVYVEKTKDGFTHIIDDVKIVDVSCGVNHTVSMIVDDKLYAFEPLFHAVINEHASSFARQSGAVFDR